MLRADWIKFVKGDRLAFRRMYDAYVDDLFAFGMSIYPDREIILDCIHDLFVNIYGNSRIAKDVNIKYYLFAALRRSILKRKEQSNRWADIDELFEEKQSDIAIKSIEDEIILAEISDNNTHLILQSLEKLPKRQREIIHLRYYMNFSYEEISKIMDVNVATCRTLSYRAIKLLQQHLPTLGQLGVYFFILK